MQIINERITWIDITNPNREDINYLREHFDFHPLILEELQRPSIREKVEDFKDYLYMVVHFPAFSANDLTSVPTELDILATKDHVITVHYRDLDFLREMFNKCIVDPRMKNQCFSRTSGHLIYFLIDEMLEHCIRQLAHIGNKIDLIERDIFSEHDIERIKEISYLKRDILDFRRIMRPLEHEIKSLEHKGVHFFGERMEIYLADLLGDYLRVWNRIENFKDTIEALETTHTNIINNQANEVMRTFTILAFTTFPLSLLVGLLSIDAKSNPIFKSQYGFWIVLALVIIGICFMLAAFKKKKWL